MGIGREMMQAPPLSWRTADSTPIFSSSEGFRPGRSRWDLGVGLSREALLHR
jgi:hypothetical protein